MARIIRPLTPEITRIVFNAGNRRIVLVEGESDRGILEHWFSTVLSEVSFHEVGGSKEVQDILPQALAISTRKRIFGIIDRDYRKEDEALKWRTEVEPHLFILPRHELENYLLEPDALESEIRTVHLGKPGLPTIADIETKLLQLAQILLPLAAANWICFEQGKALPFGESSPSLERNIVVNQIAKSLGCSVAEAELALTNKENELRPLVTTTPDFHTCIEGKRLLYHIRITYVNAIHHDIFRNYLARAISERSNLPQDIVEIVENYILSYP